MPRLPGRTIPIAWRNLTENGWRLAASLLGVSFAVVLMFLEDGFRSGLLQSMVAVIENLNGDLIITHKGRYILSEPLSFPLRRLDSVRSVPGVASTHAMYLAVDAQTRWRNPSSGLRRRIRVIAYNPSDHLLNLPGIDEAGDAWSRPETALADIHSKRVFYGAFEPGLRSELRGREITIVGTFSMGTDFRASGSLLMNEQNLLRYLPERRRERQGDTPIDLGIVRLEEGVNPQTVQQAIAARLPGDVRVLSRDELIHKEQRFWENVAPLGVVFDIGMIMGFIVGAAICYQVLFAEIFDRLSQFATLKAMGYRDRTLLGIVLSESFYLAVLGYVVGFLVSVGLFAWLRKETGLVLEVRIANSVVIFVLTLVMCTVAGLLAGRKLRSAEPANLFS